MRAVGTLLALLVVACSSNEFSSNDDGVSAGGSGATGGGNSSAGSGGDGSGTTGGAGGSDATGGRPGGGGVPGGGGIPNVGGVPGGAGAIGIGGTISSAGAFTGGGTIGIDDAGVIGVDPDASVGGGPPTDGGVVNACSSDHPDSGVFVRAANDDSATDPDLRVYVVLTNATNAALSLDGLRIRYFFTSEITLPLIAELYQVEVDDSLGYRDLLEGSPDPVSIALSAIAPTYGAPGSVTITFASGAGELLPGGNLLIDFTVHESGFLGEFNEIDDYSYNGCTQETLNPKVVVATGSDQVLWGSGPG